MLLLTVGAIAAVWLLTDKAGDSSNAQFEVASMKLALADLQSAPFNADPDAGGSPSRSARRIQADELLIARGLTSDAQKGVPPRLLARGRANLAEIDPVILTIYQLALQKGGLTAAGGSVAKLQEFLTTRSAAFSSVLDQISQCRRRPFRAWAHPGQGRDDGGDAAPADRVRVLLLPLDRRPGCRRAPRA